jgi:hypothetical protein
VSRLRWVFLAYKLPREPSTPRITLWRKLRRLGAAQVLDGLVALPLDARTREQFEWLADEIAESNGDSSLWIAEAATAAMERRLAEQMTAAVIEEYNAIRDEALMVTGSPDGDRRRLIARLRRELHQVRARDFFPPPQAAEATSAVEALAMAWEESRR